MKSLILTLALIAPTLAMACTQHEMQFSGKAVHVTHHSFNQNIKQICSYEISPTIANPSVTCPLTEDDVVGVRFADPTCTLIEGSEISGVIVRRNNTYWVE